MSSAGFSEERTERGTEWSEPQRSGDRRFDKLQVPLLIGLPYSSPSPVCLRPCQLGLRQFFPSSLTLSSRSCLLSSHRIHERLFHAVEDNDADD